MLTDDCVHTVRVIGCDGTASMVDVVTALEWVHANVEMPAAVLMSLGGPVATILDAAAQSVTDIGITVVVAGGNSATGAAHPSQVSVQGRGNGCCGCSVHLGL